MTVTPYKKRPIRFLELWEESGWRMKVYGIAFGQAVPNANLVAIGKRIAGERIAAITELSIYRVGFIGIHQGRTANFIFIDWWANENELFHHAYVSPIDAPDQFSYVTPTGLTACVWDLRVMCFERQAWLETVLQSPNGPNICAYLDARLSEDI
jgi:hypothetical protein